jgi:hypothetical protein
MRKKNWKYIPRARGLGELYDLGKDPGERVNVAERNPEIVKEMAGVLEEAKR